MCLFKDIDDVYEWLEPMTYDQFWDEVGPYNLDIPLKPGGDAQLAAGEVDLETITIGLKTLARVELTEIFGLKPRMSPPIASTFH